MKVTKVQSRVRLPDKWRMRGLTLTVVGVILKRELMEGREIILYKSNNNN